mmetsp:Transcript_6246/g.38819  ORF Transcript_6246/g.38819 Transcript_6246/m.38819 type:complete len:81 (-) Transcript_6246:569-811(-)
MVGKPVMTRSQQLAGQGVSYWPRNKEKEYAKDGFFPQSDACRRDKDAGGVETCLSIKERTISATPPLLSAWLRHGSSSGW